MAVSGVYDSASDDRIPETLFGYTVLGFLARGAASVLYYVKHPKTPGIHVLKHVKVRSPRDERFYQQLRTEYLIGRKAIHPGIRRSLEIHVKRPWLKGVTEAALLMEHCDGYTLEERTPTDNTERACVFLRAATAIAALHEHGYVHCDVKPANIVVKALAHSTLIDLGQACPVGTIKERIQGTPNFMAPEQAHRGVMTPRTDVYCFGATLYITLTKVPLPTVMTASREDSSRLDKLTTPPHVIDPSIPADLSSLVMDCARTSPEDRPADMRVVVDRLKEVGATTLQRVKTGARG